MSKFFAHMVFDSEDGSVGLADSDVADTMFRTQANDQKGLPFSEIDLLELAAMNSHDDNL